MFVPKGSTKEIAYAYPSSPMAEELGFGKTGCYYIEYVTDVEDGWNHFHDSQVGGFEKICSDLIDSFEEADGCPNLNSIELRPHYYERA